MSSSSHLTRRRFVKASSWAAAGLLLKGSKLTGLSATAVAADRPAAALPPDEVLGKLLEARPAPGFPSVFF